MNTWYDYRTVWSSHPWLLVYAVGVVLVFIVAVIGTIVGGPLAILFLPSLGGAYVHHLLVGKRLNEELG